MKNYKISKFLMVVYLIRGIAPLFLGLFIPYLVFIEKSFNYKAGYIIGTVATIAILIYGVIKLKSLNDNYKRSVQYDDTNIVIDGFKLPWGEIDMITFQPAEEFGPAIVVKPKGGSADLEVPASIGVRNLIELGAEIEEKAKKYSIELKKIELV